MSPDATTTPSIIERIVYLKTWSRSCRRLVKALPDWITPNFVTLVRAAMALPIFQALSTGCYRTALAFFALAMALDVLDGAIAHIKDMCTPSGAFLDPLADKLIFCSALAAVWDKLPSWILILAGAAVVYAAGITVLRMYRMVLARRLDSAALAASVSARTAGKVKTAFDVLAVLMIMAGLALDSRLVVDTGGAVVVIGSIVAGALYFLPSGQATALRRTDPEPRTAPQKAV